MKPQHITHREADALFASESNGKYRPLGLFYEIGSDNYIGIDNSTGDALVEEFETKAACLEWLNREKDDSEYQRGLSYQLALIASFVLYGFALKKAVETGIMDGSMLLCILPMVIYFFVSSIKDYTEWCKGENRKE